MAEESPEPEQTTVDQPSDPSSDVPEEGDTVGAGDPTTGTTGTSGETDGGPGSTQSDEPIPTSTPPTSEGTGDGTGEEAPATDPPEGESGAGPASTSEVSQQVAGAGDATTTDTGGDETGTQTEGTDTELEDDSLESEPQAAALVNVNDANLSEVESAEVQALVEQGSDEVTVQAALVPVVAGPEEVVAVLVGEGITYSNIAYTGAPGAIGTFSGGTGIIGFESGAVLSSGLIENIVGPNDASNTTGNNGNPGDADLDAELESPGITRDAAVLTFDFVPSGNKVVFSYVFSSEEYNEYVDSQYNVVFAFYINGENCATVEGGRVSINSINNNTNAAYYVDNEDGHLNTEMDGLTVVLTCEADVSAGQTNTIKLAIADTSDFAYDSNVFIQAKSFVVSTPTATVPAKPTQTPKAEHTPKVKHHHKHHHKYLHGPVTEPEVVVVVKTHKVDAGQATGGSQTAVKLPNTGSGHDDGIQIELIISLMLASLATGLGAVGMARRSEE